MILEPKKVKSVTVSIVSPSVRHEVMGPDECAMCTLVYLRRITNRVLLDTPGNSAQCYMAARMGGESRGERIHVYVWLSPFAVHLKL